LVNAVAPAGGVVVGVPLNRQLENDLSCHSRRGQCPDARGLPRQSA
jgi:hypothetical protein